MAVKHGQLAEIVAVESVTDRVTALTVWDFLAVLGGRCDPCLSSNFGHFQYGERPPSSGFPMAN